MSTKQAKVKVWSRYNRLVAALVASNGVTLLLFLMRSAESQTDRYWFLLWNLFLAWLPLLFAVCLVDRLRTTAWSTWQNIILTVFWVGLLPNSFYLVSDLIHLHETGEVSLLYDIVMFCSFIFNAYIAGFMSVFIVHQRLLKRFAAKWAYLIIAVVLLACSFAIYLGRSLRWNSWDILVNPAGLIFDVSDRVVNPAAHTQSFVTTITFFLLLMSTYAVFWELAILSNPKHK